MSLLEMHGQRACGQIGRRMNLPNLAVLASLTAFASSILPVHAANITWRGGSGNDFATVANWNLPPDIPPGTPAGDLENFRRVPLATDRGIIRGADVTFSANRTVGSVDSDGRITLAAGVAVSTAQTSEDNLFGSLELGAGARIALVNPAVTGEALLGAGAELACDTPGTLGSLRLVSASLRLGTTGSQVVITGKLTLEGTEPTGQVLFGKVTAKGGVDWLRGPTFLAPDASLTVGDPNTAAPVEFRCLGTDAAVMNFSAPPGLESIEAITLQPGVALRHGTVEHVFDCRVDFRLLSRGIPVPESDVQPLVFLRDVTLRDFQAGAGPDGTLAVSGPARFHGGDVTLTAESASSGPALFPLRLRAPVQGGVRQAVEFRGNAKVNSNMSLEAEALVMDDSAVLTLEAEPGAPSAPVLSTGLAADTPGDAARSIRMRNGAITGALHIRRTGSLLLGPRREGASEPDRMQVRGALRNEGLIDFAVDPLVPNRAVEGSGVWRNQGLIRMPAGHGFRDVGLALPLSLEILNLGGLIEVTERALVQNDGGSTRSFLAHTLICRPASGVPGGPANGGLFISKDAHVQLREGHIDAANSITGSNPAVSLADRAVLDLTGKGAHTTYTFTGEGSQDETVTLDGMLTFGAEADVFLGPDSALHILGSGLNAPAGLRSHKFLEVDHLIMGGSAEVQPVLDLVSPSSALVVKKTFAWFGGRILGHGAPSDTAPKVIVRAAAQMDIRGTPENIGGPCRLENGLVFELLGGVIIDKLSTVTTDATSKFLFRPGSNALIIRTHPGTLFTPAIENEGTVTVNTGVGTFDSTILGGSFENKGEGTLKITAGRMTARNATLTGGNFKVEDPSATMAFDNVTLHNFTGEGDGAFAVPNSAVTFSGNCRLKSLNVGTGSSSPILLKSAPDTVVNVESFFTWISGGIDLGVNSKIVLEETCQSTISGNFTPTAGEWRRGKIEDHGETTYVAESPGKFVVFSSASYENLGTFIIQGAGTVFPRAFGNLNFVFLNKGLVKLKQAVTAAVDWKCKFENALGGIVQFALQAPPPPGAVLAGQAAPPPAGPNFGKVIFTEPVVFSGGVFDGRNTDVEFAALVTLTAGEVIFGGNGEGMFLDTFNINGGQLFYMGAALGRFDKATTVRNGAALHLDNGISRLEAPLGLTLIENSLLSGSGVLVGNVTVSSGRIVPGDAGPLGALGTLHFNGDLTLGANSVVEVEVPVLAGTAIPEALRVSGHVKLAGTLRPLALGGAGNLKTGFLDVLFFGTREGDFGIFDNPLFLGDKVFVKQFRDEAEDSLALTILSGAPVADLALTSTALTPLTGRNFTLPLSVKNLGPATATGASLTVTLPANVAFTSSKPAPTTRSGQVLSYALGTMTKNKVTALTLTLVAPVSDAPFVINAVVNSGTPDPVAANNVLNINGVLNADVAVTGVAPVPLAGRNFTLPLTVRNNGPAEAAGVVFTVTLPPNVPLVSAKPAPATTAGQVLTYNLGAMAKAKTQLVTLTLTAPAAEGAAFQIQALANASTADPNEPNNLFVMNGISFPAAASTYRGLVRLAGGGAVNGLFSFALTTTGALTARITVAGKTFSITGKLATDGSFTKTLAVAGLGTVTLQLDGLDADTMTGTLTFNGQTFDMVGRRGETFNAKTSPATQAGKYTLLLDPDAGPASPRGAGFATMTVTNLGAVTLACTLADGTKLTYASALDTTDSFPLFVLLYKNLGFLAGNVVFRDVPQQSDADAVLDWLKPGVFHANPGLAASLHAPVTGQHVLPGLTASVGSATATISGGGLVNDLVKALTLDVKDKVTPPAGDPEKFTLTITRSTGLITGGFTPVGGKRLTVNGVVHRKSNRMGGFFLNGVVSGHVGVVP